MAQNLIPTPYYDFQGGNTTFDTGRGVVFTLNEDGSITANGLAAGTTYCTLIYWGALAGGAVGDVVTLRGCPAGGGRDTYYLHLTANDAYAEDTGAGAKLIITEDLLNGDSLELTITVQEGAQVDNVVFKPYVGIFTLAEKLEVIAENEQAVYDAGVKAGQAAADAAYDEGVAAVWEAIQQGGKRTNYNSIIYGNQWNDDNFKPRYDIKPTGSALNLFANTNMTDIKKSLQDCGVVLDTSGATNLNFAFNGIRSTTLPTINCAGLTTVVGVFNSEYLRSIDCVVLKEDGSQNMAEMFKTLKALENITFQGTIGNSITFSASSKLTNASVQSIIDHLADLTSKTAQTLTLHATVGAQMTEAQKATCTAKNWTLVY